MSDNLNNNQEIFFILILHSRQYYFIPNIRSNVLIGLGKKKFCQKIIWS